MLTLQNISYTHPNKDLLFSVINLTVNNYEKTALIGNNGVGKSTLLKIIAGELQPSSGQISIEVEPYYVPQIFGQFNHLTIAQALRIEDKLNALKEILNGNTIEENFNLLNDDWTIEDRCTEALSYWQLNDLDLSQKMEVLSGGQKTKVFLAGISIHRPEIILMDEPSNHLDLLGRRMLYDFIKTTSSSLIVVSHDRELLNLLNIVYELSKRGLTVYGGNYDFNHCTSAAYSNSFLLHKEPALLLTDFVKQDNSILTAPLSATFRNCIFWGDNGTADDEVVSSKQGSGTYSANFQNCLWKVKNNPANITSSNIIANQDPIFDSVNNSRRFYNFRLKDESPAKNKGIGSGISIDLDGNPRAVGLPDIGCYEKQ